ncbi:MAG: MarR family transcriptional regulator [Euzebyaceae bacterium]|jgi:DNA-binding MarR family transcriptional regulator|nr:MarR family transcriptional regulator [Euzebyaceae bacterium]
MADDAPGFALPLLLLQAFRAIVDDLHEELARAGHPGVRPVHGFALQAIRPQGATAAELGRRLGVSKQAAAKTIDALERLGYAVRRGDPADGRRKLVCVTPRGVDLLELSARLLDRIRGDWAARLGQERATRLERDLATLAERDGAAHALRVDAPGWFGHHE